MINMYSNPGLVTKERVTQTCPKCAISHLFDFSVIVLWIKLAIRGGKRAVFDNNSHFYYPMHSLTIFLDPFKPKYAQSTNVIITAFSPQKTGSWLIAPDLVNCIVKKGIKYAFSPKNNVPIRFLAIKTIGIDTLLVQIDRLSMIKCAFNPRLSR